MTPGALAGLRVLDLTRHLPGPYCTMLLGELGADVIKIEEPVLGDPTRALPPAVGHDTALHAILNRNKRSVAVDLRSAAGAEVVRRLALRADVLVESFRPGVLERRGLGAQALLAANPRLVYGSLTSYGSQGPLAARAGHDIDYLARAGFLAANRDRQGEPVLPGVQLADMAGALGMLVGVLAALHARERSGRGQRVQASLFESALGLLTMPLARRLAGGGAQGELSGAYACYRVYRCADARHVAVGALEAKFWEKLCRALGHPELIGHQWQASRQAETIQVLAASFGARDRDAWLGELGPLDVCVEPVLELEEAAAQQAARNAMLSLSVGSGEVRTAGLPFQMGETPAAVRRGAPRLGEHTSEVLGELGYSPAQIEQLQGAGAVA